MREAKIWKRCNKDSQIVTTTFHGWFSDSKEGVEYLGSTQLPNIIITPSRRQSKLLFFPAHGHWMRPTPLDIFCNAVERKICWDFCLTQYYMSKKSWPNLLYRLGQAYLYDGTYNLLIMVRSHLSLWTCLRHLIKSRAIIGIFVSPFFFF